MIKSLEVRGLNNHGEMNFKFEPDLNLLTGKNGSSKTTLLKLLWYMNGGRFVELLSEVNFQYADLVTSSNRIIVSKDSKNETFSIKINKSKAITIREENIRELDFRRNHIHRDNLLEIRRTAIGAIFFPTFRRIEGGFSMEEGVHDPRFRRSSTDSLKDAMQELSNRLSFANQKFVASISTDDIVQLLTTEYARINERVNGMQKAKSDSIIKKIKNRSKNEKKLLAEIQSDIEQMEANREEEFKPFTTLSNLITKIFQHKGIHLNNLTIGDVSNAISSDKLSAGEKQMLSFICYNTFVNNQTIFIDEPELSLHPDWQRTLVPTLLNQGNENQFFMATHSPFIYSKYSDKEIILSADKGN